MWHRLRTRLRMRKALSLFAPWELLSPILRRRHPGSLSVLDQRGHCENTRLRLTVTLAPIPVPAISPWSGAGCHRANIDPSGVAARAPGKTAVALLRVSPLPAVELQGH